MLPPAQEPKAESSEVARIYVLRVLLSPHGKCSELRHV
jgi:hypothetical protein